VKLADISCFTCRNIFFRNSGRVIAEKDVKTSQGQLSADKSQVGSYNFDRVDSREEFGNGLIKQSGSLVTGQYATVVSDGSGNIISSHVKQGPSYSGALAMALDGKIPEGVFDKTANAANFSKNFAEETNKLWKGDMSHENGENKQLRITGGAGGKFKGISGSVQRINSNSNTWKESHNADTVSAMVYAVATSDMKNSDKISQIQEIAERIVERRNITPEAVPNSRQIMTGEEESNPADDLKRAISGKPPKPKGT